jgi:tetratricopeptide (TPR) repeat protein
LLATGQRNTTEEKKALKLFEQAKVAYESKQLAKSLDLLDQVLSADSCFLDAYLLKSDIYMDVDSIKLQIKACETALKIDPEKNIKLYYLLGKAYYRS